MRVMKQNGGSDGAWLFTGSCIPRGFGGLSGAMQRSPPGHQRTETYNDDEQVRWRGK